MWVNALTGANVEILNVIELAAADARASSSIIGKYTYTQISKTNYNFVRAAEYTILSDARGINYKLQVSKN